ncbi:MAG: threonine/serine ThrE exporter family protein [Bacteroidota bacterium]
MIAEASLQTFDQMRTEESGLLECLRKIGKGMIASGVSVGVVENTLTEIAMAYGMECEIVALPNVVLIQLNHSSRGRVEFAVQRLTTLQLDQVSELAEIIDQVRQKKIPLDKASGQMDRILAKPPRFKPAVGVLGYFLSCVGLTMLFRPDPLSLLITGTMGILVGLMLWGFQKMPRFNLLLPVIISTVVSTLIFYLTRQGYIYGPANLLVAPLVIFLPGSLLTTGMIELASMHILSGSARLIYGVAMLMLLFMGIAIGLNLSNLPSYQVYAYQAVSFPWWAPFLGTLLFGLGTFVRLSGANRDLFWMLLVLYVAMLGQALGDYLINPYFGAFVGATLMALSSEVIGRSPRRTPAVVSQVLAFWFLVPGSRGLLSVTSLLTKDIQSAAIGLGQMVILIIAITLGVLLGTLITSPQKFVPVTAAATASRR